MPTRNKIALVVAGGEIGMKYSEKKNGHTPELSAEEMLSWLPSDVSDSVQLVDWSHQASSHYTVRMTSDLMEILSKLVIDGAQGIVVTCGTDAMEEMAYLADLIWAYPQPVIFTGTNSPSDVIGSDAVINLRNAVKSALSQTTWGMGVLVCIQDQLLSASEMSQGMNYRKNGFISFDRGPVGEIIGEAIDIRRVPKRGQVLEGVVPARNVEVLYSSLGGGERLIASLASSSDLPDGLVLAAFGNGNVFPAWIPYIKALLKSEVPVLLSSRCPHGKVISMFGFEGSTSRLFDIGVMDGGDLPPLKARLRLSVGIGAGLTGQDLQRYILDR
ncbi:MAG: asparaginase [Synergistales bacterium]|nr:asparaginase [Dethiosulfovibrio sp.]NCC96364.1 asparaginase [Synergistales bacterium]